MSGALQTESELPLVSVIVPMRNEVQHIRKCLESLVDQDYPEDRLEILVIDGMSDDGSREIVAEAAGKFNHIRLLDNPRGTTPAGKNIGIENSRGRVVIILSAHSSVTPQFVSQNVHVLGRTDADCVGGPIETVGEGYVGQSIALALSSPFGVGNSRFRYSQKAQFVDTVAFGAYRREVFERIGLFDEHLIRNQDNDFHSRLKRTGGKIFLSPTIKSYYYARSSLRGLWKQAFKTGMWNIFTLRHSSGSLSIRHFIPLFFVLALLGNLLLSGLTSWGWAPLSLLLSSYFSFAIVFSLGATLRNGLRYLPILPVIFFSYHFSYGAGSIWGLVQLGLGNRTTLTLGQGEKNL
jgi:glycosyltransferase involved in cell wall biosynthesis